MNTIVGRDAACQSLMMVPADPRLKESEKAVTHGQAHVITDQIAVGIEEQIGRLEVTMDDVA
jgi:hypothetical protein